MNENESIRENIRQYRRRMTQEFKEFKFDKAFAQKLIKNLFLIAFIIAFIFVFSWIFGKENQLIGVALSAGILMFREVSIGIRKNQAPLVIFGLCLMIGGACIFAPHSPLAAFFVHVTAIFVLMYAATEKIEYKTYIPFILMYIFAQGNPITPDLYGERMAAFIVSGIVLALVYYVCNRKDDGGVSVSRMISDIKIHDTRTTFVLKMAVGVGLVMFAGQIFGLEKSMWLSLTVMSLTQPYYYMTKHRTLARISATVCGLILYIVIFGSLLPAEALLIATFVMAYMYTFIKNYFIQIVFITISALNAANGLLETEFLAERVLFIAAAAVLAFALARFEYKYYTKNEHLRTVKNGTNREMPIVTEY